MPDLLTRNFYRFTDVERFEDRTGRWVRFRMKVNGEGLDEGNPFLYLGEGCFDDLVADLGMRPIHGGAECESMPLDWAERGEAKNPEDWSQVGR